MPVTTSVGVSGVESGSVESIAILVKSGCRDPREPRGRGREAAWVTL